MPSRLRCLTVRSLTWGSIGLAVLLLITPFVPIRFLWGRESLTLVDGGAFFAYQSFGCEWSDLAKFPHVSASIEPPSSRSVRCWPLPFKSSFSFCSWRIAYFPIYMLFPLLATAAWNLRRCRT